jgi:K+-transporting ATPase ATPase C chain
MLKQLRPAIVLVALSTVVLGLAFPLGFVGLARAVLPFQANGSLIERDGKVVGSALIGQNWTQDKYLQGRPSATTAPDPADASKTVAAPYNAANSGASNAGPTSKALIDRVTEDAKKMGGTNIPGDALTTSASGLDPDISPEFAALQVPRIAKARGVPDAQVQAVVAANTAGRLLGLIGEPRVNVLAVNLALDGAAATKGSTVSQK